MSGKRGSLAGFAAKKDVPPPPTPTPISETPKELAADKRRGQTLRLSVEAWRQLKRLAVDQDKPAHDLLVEAVNELFRKNGLPPIA